MNIKTLVSKYINSAEKVLKKIQKKSEIRITNKEVDMIINYAKNYLKDAKYYQDQKKYETSLISIAYCEGLLDALKLLDVVNFDWVTRETIKK
jgi:FAD synthetase